jgi:hypothetical protein
MERCEHLIFGLLLILALLVPSNLKAQQKDDPAAQEKKMREFIDSEVERLTSTLNLEEWQVFYVDSTLNHDYKALNEEFKKMSDAKITNYDIYTAIQDKWMGAIYNSYHKFLKPDQWAKYLKSGAARDQKARDKRKEKAEKANGLVDNK